MQQEGVEKNDFIDPLTLVLLSRIKELNMTPIMYPECFWRESRDDTTDLLNVKLKVFREQTEENIYQCHLRDSPVKNTLVNTFRAKIGANTVADVVKLVPLLKQTAVYIYKQDFLFQESLF